MNPNFEVYAATILSELYTEFPKCIGLLEKKYASPTFEEKAPQEIKKLYDRIRYIEKQIAKLKDKKQNAEFILLLGERQPKGESSYSEQLRSDVRHAESALEKIESETRNLST